MEMKTNNVSFQGYDTVLPNKVFYLPTDAQ